MPKPKYIQQFQDFVRSATVRLALSYLAVIMVMSLGFSFVIYSASAYELGRQLPSPSSFGVQRFDEIQGTGPRIDDFFEQRIAEGRHALLLRLVLLNVSALAVGSVVSYYLARRTLRPIENNMEAQAQFVSDASHELRTPLTVLRTTNEVALRRPKLTTAEAHELLRLNVAEVTKLQTLTESLLRLAKPDAADGLRRPVSLQDVTTEALAYVIQPATDKHITVQDTVPAVMVHADPQALAQALVTIVDNAIKYSASKRTVEVSGGKEGKYGFIKVADKGAGIAAHDLPHIFDRFYRADQSRTKNQTDGYGIGLALAKKIVDQHNGEIEVHSTLGKGTTVTLRIPLELA